MIELNLIKVPAADHKIRDYYEGATAEYKTWSKDYYMHFGLWHWGINPFSRKAMLEEMNRLVLQELCLEETGETVADLGCGIGAVTAFAQKNHPGSHFTGLTLVNDQVRFGKQFYGDDLDIRCGDFHDLPFMSNSLGGAFFLESFCHSEHPALVLDELARCMKPGSRLVVADGFLTKPVARLRNFERKCHDVVASNFALPGFPVLQHTVALLKSFGFTDVKVTNMSYKIAACAMHAPGLTIWAWLQKKLRGQKLDEVQKQHFKACFASLFLGMTPSFRYCVITATKK